MLVILLCDPYTEIGYFETIGYMVECVKQNVAEFVLMGITPTYPSKKFGYIVPQSYEPSATSQENTYRMIYRKLTSAVAEELLKQKHL